MAFYGGIKDYPFLTAEEFHDACHFLDHKYIGATLGSLRRTFRFRLNRNLASGEIYASIMRPIDMSQYHITFDLENLAWGSESVSGEDACMDLAAENEDFERSQPDFRKQTGLDSQHSQPPGYTPVSQQPYVVYEIHLSPTYRTPVLFFTLYDLPPLDSKWDLDVVYRYLIPDEFKDQLRAYGPIGAISADCHPITGVPTFRVHPCGTPDAMRPLECSLKDYLQIWLGLVGPCVGLHVPLAIAELQL